jgi:hypothetical protein
MRKSEALYYPNIEPPMQWLMSAALFFDSVRSFVPTDSDELLSAELREFAEHTQAWTPYRPTQDTAQLLDVSNQILDEVFRSIADGQKTQRELHITIDTSGRVQIPGHVFMHNSKLSGRVAERLQAHGLILPGEFAGDNWLTVNEKASDLVISYIADRLAALEGWTSITNNEGLYVFNAVGSVGSPDVSAADQLARMMITDLVPDVIDRLSLKRYNELRQRYQPIRERLNQFIDETIKQDRLNRIGDMTELNAAIHDCTAELRKEIREFKKSSFGKEIRKWGPFALTGLIRLAKSISHINSELALALEGVSLTIGFIDKTGVLQDKSNNREEMVRLLAAARNDIIGSLDIKRFLVA